MPIQNAKIISIQTAPVSYHMYGIGGYHRGDKEYTMSRSALMEFDHCPHRWISGFEKKKTDSLSYGNMIDAYVLDFDRFDSQFVVAPEEYYSESKKEDMPWNWRANYCKEWREKAVRDGKSVIKASEAEECVLAKKALFNDETIASFIESSDKQVMITAEWKDDSGLIVPLKCLIDLAPKEGQYLGDLKTCRTAANSTWAREIYNYGYHVQAAFYGDMYYAATGEARDGFVHILQENYPPYEPGRRLLSEEFMEIGQGKYRNALRKYCECLKSGNWPGYDDDDSRKIDGFTITEPELWMIEKGMVD